MVWCVLVAAGYEGAAPRLMRVLERLTVLREKEVPAEYMYYGIPSPWLQVGTAGRRIERLSAIGRGGWGRNFTPLKG